MSLLSEIIFTGIDCLKQLNILFLHDNATIQPTIHEVGQGQVGHDEVVHGAQAGAVHRPQDHQRVGQYLPGMETHFGHYFQYQRSNKGPFTNVIQSLAIFYPFLPPC